jgi:hypothetical protein
MKKSKPIDIFAINIKISLFLNRRFLSKGLIREIYTFFGNRFAPPVFSAQGAERGGISPRRTLRREEASSAPFLQA